MWDRKPSETKRKSQLERTGTQVACLGTGIALLRLMWSDLRGVLSPSRDGSIVP